MKKILLLAGIGLSMTVFGKSTDDIAIGRYLTVSNTSMAAQRDLLSQTVQVHFPTSVNTIGGAMTYLLRYSGYALVAEGKQSDALKNTLKKPLPLVDRDFGPMTLRDALITLAGPAFSLEHDALNREVNFTVKPAFLQRKK